MHSNWSFLSELLFCFMHLADKVDKSVASLGHSLLGPLVELELPQSTRATIACIRNFELSQYIQWHIVLGYRLHHQTVISNRTFWGPVLVALFLKLKKLLIFCSNISLHTLNVSCEIFTYYLKKHVLQNQKLFWRFGYSWIWHNVKYYEDGERTRNKIKKIK